MKTKPKSRFAAAATALLAAALIALIAAVPASAAIFPTRVPTSLGGAMDLPNAGGEFLTIPTAGAQAQEPHGTASELPGFPRGGNDISFAIMTTGDVALADDPNVNESSGLDLFGPNIRGTSDRDVSVLRLAVPVTPNANCLSFEFRFLSEEFPEFVGSSFNDVFIAELRNSTWTTSGSDITAPDNFAFDEAGNEISVNSVGQTAVAPYRAIATTYDSATRIARASAPVTAADHSAGFVNLFLSIFDHGDGIYDSAAFIDNLIVDQRSNCTQGAQILDPTDPETAAEEPEIKVAPSPPAGAAVASKKKKKVKVSVDFSSSESGSTFFCRLAKVRNVAETPYSLCESPFKAKVKKGKYQFDVVAVDGAGNPDPTPVSTRFKAKKKKK